MMGQEPGRRHMSSQRLIALSLLIVVAHVTAAIAQAPLGCKTDAQCDPFKGAPIACARLCKPEAPNNVSGPACNAHYCFQKTVCATLPACGSGQTCSKDADCDFPRGLACRLCVQGRTPSCATATCVKGYCHTVLPCDLQLPPAPPPSPSPPPPKFKNPHCSSDKDCKLTSKACAKTCPKKTYTGSSSSSVPGPTCEGSYCWKRACVLQQKCGGKKCSKQSDCAVKNVAYAKCKAGFFPGSTTTTCKNGYCHSIPLCSLPVSPTPPPSPAPPAKEFVNTTCAVNADCVFDRPIACAKCASINGTQTYPGPGCEKAFCFQNTCVAQEICGGKSCSSDSDCEPSSKVCALCVKDRFPPCNQGLCKNGFCSNIAPCSLVVRPPPPPSPPVTPPPSPPPSPFINDTCSVDADCKFSGPIVCAGCALPDTGPGEVKGPGCQSAFCFQNKCVDQSVCSGKRCQADGDCPAATICALCVKNKFPGCNVSKCANGFCSTIQPCSLDS